MVVSYNFIKNDNTASTELTYACFTLVHKHRRNRKRKDLHTRTQATQARWFISCAYDCAYVLSLHTRRFQTQAQSQAQNKHIKNKIFLFLTLALAITFFSLHTRFFLYCDCDCA